MKEYKSIAVAGIPNCGKTTFFNAITGSHHKVGNWPGVTVERIEGSFKVGDRRMNIVDLPGTYNLNPDSDDQKVAENEIREDAHDLIINIVDASNLNRNLFLTFDILKITRNVVVFLNMNDIAEKEGLIVNPQRLSEELGVPVIPVVSINRHSVARAKSYLIDFLTREKQPETHDTGIVRPNDSADKIYHAIDRICRMATDINESKESLTDRIDRVLLNKWASVPIFMGAMFLVFWFAIGVGGVFIDFFDIVAGTFLVDLPQWLLSLVHSPQWLNVVFEGVGAGLQTVATFIPVVFFMFAAIAFLEDLGYMARIGVLTDRLMRRIGLPGNAFIPMMVGFGCTVPAIMAARTMTSKRDRYMTIFMVPFMSCGARLPVYALFSAALFGRASGLIVFIIYLTGLGMAIFTGFLLKNTLFKGRESTFVVDLPLYHVPRPRLILKNATTRMGLFVKKAGVIITVAVFLLSIFNAIGFSNGKVTFGDPETDNTVLVFVGKKLTPIFVPMGVERDNWPATVALFTGLFAKEAIVGTVNSLYATMGEGIGAEGIIKYGGFPDLLGAAKDALVSVKEGFVGLVTTADPLGVGQIAQGGDAGDERLTAENATFFLLRKHFTPLAGFAYLLFVLIYFPCLAVVGAAKQEMGAFYTMVLICYTTFMAWATATIFYQVVEGHNILFLLSGVFVLAFIFFGLRGLAYLKKDETVRIL